jgi:hypothetical protein
MTSTSTSTDASGTSTETMTIEGTTLTIVSTDTPTGGSATTTTTNGTVNASTMTVGKDGTWSRNLDITITDDYDFGGTTFTITSNSVMAESGTWDFLNGVSKDFKKNERVVFNTLSSTTTTTTTTEGGGISDVSTDVDTQTYAEGEMSEVMVVVESKGKELQMSSDAASTSTSSETSGGSTTTTNSSASSTTTITLMQQ